MWDHPAAFALGKRDLIGAWLVCLAFGAACFVLLAAASPEPGGSSAALIDPGQTPTVAVAAAASAARC
jgi:hypothetical protein